MKNGASGEVRAAVDDFVAKLAGIMRRESLAHVTRALGDSFAAHTGGNGNGKSNGNGNGHAEPRPGSGQKRSPEDLAATVKALGEYIAEHPGQGVEQIKVALNKQTSELMLPIQKLLTARVITRKGQKRATKYFPAGKAAAKA